MGINNPLMIIMAVEEAVKKKDVWDTLLIGSYRGAPRETLNRMQH